MSPRQSDIADMKCWLLRLAQKRWRMPAVRVAQLFSEAGVYDYVTELYDLLFDYFEITHVLVIAPLRVARNTWPQEIEKWDHLKDVRYSVAVGTEKERLEAFRRDADIYIINRENVQ
mgnify:CR=1 FL=1